MKSHYTTIVFFLADANNERAKFIFSKEDANLSELEAHELLQIRWVTDEITVSLLNKITERKAKALQQENYLLAAQEHCLEEYTICKAAFNNGMEYLTLKAHRDFACIRCYLIEQNGYEGKKFVSILK